MLIFIIELCFNLTITFLISVVQRELLIMMFLMHQALVMIEFTCVVDSLNWKNEMFTSQLCRCHMTIETTATRVQNRFL